MYHPIYVDEIINNTHIFWYYRSSLFKKFSSTNLSNFLSPHPGICERSDMFVKFPLISLKTKRFVIFISNIMEKIHTWTTTLAEQFLLQTSEAFLILLDCPFSKYIRLVLYEQYRDCLVLNKKKAIKQVTNFMSIIPKSTISYAGRVSDTE